jgi:putative ABC transport system permease protein
MKTPDLVDLAARNLRESMLRNSLTTLGIGVGVASLVAMLSLGVGLQQMATQRLAKSGLFDTVMVASWPEFGGMLARARGASAAAGEVRPLDDSARQAIANLPGVLEAVPDLRWMTQVRIDGKPHRAMVAGIPMSARDRESFENLQGSFFSSANAAEAILQKRFAEELLGVEPSPDEAASDAPSPALASLVGKELEMSYAKRIPGADSSSGKAGTEPVGKAITRSNPANQRTAASAQESDAAADALLSGFAIVPRSRTLRIVGIVAQDPDSMRGQGRARIFIPLEFVEGLQAILPSDLREGASDLAGRTYTAFAVRVRSARDVPAVEDSVRRMGFTAFSALDASRNLQRFFAVLDVFLGIFGSLAAAVASLGIANTLVMTILERRREIGILKALGASDWDVKKLFFAEAGAMGIVGGVLGVALGWAMGQVINAGTNVYLHRQNLPSETFWSVPWWLVLGAMGFSVAMSLVSGLYPAARAAKLDPVKALRYE